MLLDRILENTSSTEPLRVEPKSSHEEVSSVEFESLLPTLLDSTVGPSPELGTLEEEIQPPELPFFKEELFEDFGNTSNYSCRKKPPVPITPLDPLDKDFLRKTIKELTAIMSSKWVEEAKLSSEEIQIRVPSLTI